MQNSTIRGTPTIPEQPPSATGLLTRLQHELQRRLSSSWRLEIMRIPARRPGRPSETIAAELRLTAPDGTAAQVTVAARRRLDAADIAPTLQQIPAAAQRAGTVLLLAPFIGPRAREVLHAARYGYADATGNLYLQLERPSVYIEASGATKHPWDEPRPLRSLRGPAAARVVRALCDFCPPYGVRELAEIAGAPASSVSRVATLLATEMLVTRGPHGEVGDVQWASLLRRWTHDYGLQTSHRVETYLAPRGLDWLCQQVARLPLPYAVTASLAAVRYAPYAPPRLASIYVPEIAAAAEALSLHSVERGANVLLIEPFDPVVYERCAMDEGVQYAAPSQVVADLLTAPGRAPAEAEALIHWMEQHQEHWRR